MINLIIPQNLGLTLFDNIIKGKRIPVRTRLQALRPVIEQRYNLYENNKYELSVIKKMQFQNTEAKDMLSCYGTNKYLSLAKKILNDIQRIEQQGTCVYCGIGEPTTLDHYLPKDDFPELSVLGENLVPCCSRCNELKGESWLDRNGNRSIINFYFDDIVQYEFLQITIKYSAPIPTVPTAEFQLIQTSQISNEKFNLINSHFSILHLIDRYRKKVNEEISNVFTDVRSSAHLIGRDLQKVTLQQKASNLRTRYGHNYWKACLYEAISRSDLFFDACYAHIN
jgi:5-methylcytosine-specific restriction endonuclease McrA